MSLVSLSIEDNVATVTFCNPPRGYMNAQQVQELDEVIGALAGDDDVRAVVFTGGVPGVFIRHYDVAEILAVADVIRKSGRSDDELTAGAKAGNAVSTVFDKVDRLPKPTIAAINGFAQGGGFEFALCCDLRIADPGDYRIGLPETNIGIFPGAGGTERLPRLIGEARALELILRGRTVEPDEALALGMVHEVASRGALARAQEIAKELAAKPPRGLAEAKALVKGAANLPLDDACGLARGRFSVLIARDDDAENAMRGFLAHGEDINKN
ncbi:MAG: enoyl-CoA hydratase/isomerase family protein [Parvibaculum sp.]|uniref:enoyl-CoA hydratase/isomerase family protein n=1 Tax=Parvibaculum sp. TaxID=2024848 RepID=UPI0025FA352F|nr:enoyl-CoA hydratase/isomerase family protein [Parvibaculum sp.]MCE9649274.1 enoyl-CoA hydratase/isomerase family protein [Parvibaculum sp.]